MHKLRLASIFILTTLTVVCNVVGQTLPTTSRDLELGFFRYVLMNLGSIDHTQIELKHRRDLFTAQYRLSPVDAVLVGSIADEFHNELLRIKAAAAPLTANGRVVTDADRAQINNLTNQRDEALQGLISRLKKGLAPDATNRILQPLAAFGASNSVQLRSGDARVLEAAWASGQRLTNTVVPLKRGFDAKAPFENTSTDANGIARCSTKYWERIEIHLPRILSVDHMACLMVNSKCAALPIGTTFDQKNSILYWHVPNAYKGDFDFVFLQPGSRAVVFRVTAGAGSLKPGEGF